MNDARTTIIGSSPTLEIRSGPPPANCAAPDSGDLVASGVLPAEWMTPSSNGIKTKLGAWVLTGALTAGAGAKGGHYRLKQGGVCHQQGTFGLDGEMKPSENWFVAGQSVTMKAFELTRGNA